MGHFRSHLTAPKAILQMKVPTCALMVNMVVKETNSLLKPVAVFEKVTGCSRGMKIFDHLMAKRHLMLAKSVGMELELEIILDFGNVIHRVAISYLNIYRIKNKFIMCLHVVAQLLIRPIKKLLSNIVTIKIQTNGGGGMNRMRMSSSVKTLIWVQLLNHLS